MPVAGIEDMGSDDLVDDLLGARTLFLAIFIKREIYFLFLTKIKEKEEKEEMENKKKSKRIILSSKSIRVE